MTVVHLARHDNIYLWNVISVQKKSTNSLTTKAFCMVCKRFSVSLQLNGFFVVEWLKRLEAIHRVYLMLESFGYHLWAIRSKSPKKSFKIGVSPATAESKCAINSLETKLSSVHCLWKPKSAYNQCPRAKAQRMRLREEKKICQRTKILSNKRYKITKCFVHVRRSIVSRINNGTIFFYFSSFVWL